MGRPRPQDVQALVLQNPIQPAEKALLRIESVQMLVRLDERGLRGIARILVVAKHPERDVEQPPLIPGDDRFVRVLLPPEAPRDDCRVPGVIHQIHPTVRKVGKLIPPCRWFTPL